ncbi:MAG TPA: hypothetical protein VNX01_01615 [Bacteroidia bacterium]|jgi:hypothetical protein|nr:hypothetical protein [Bacteroidia bacterium]
MITVAHDAPKGKLKVWAIGLGTMVLSGILIAVVLVFSKKPLHALEQALS